MCNRKGDRFQRGRFSHSLCISTIVCQYVVFNPIFTGKHLPASCFLNRSADCGSDINYKYNFASNSTKQNVCNIKMAGTFRFWTALNICCLSTRRICWKEEKKNGTSMLPRVKHKCYYKNQQIQQQIINSIFNLLTRQATSNICQFYILNIGLLL